MSTARDLLYGLVLEDGRRWGEAAVDVQRQDADAVLDQNSSTPYHYLTRARGYSKTGDLAAMNIVVLLAQAPPRGRLYALAADQAQGQLLLDAIGGYMTRTPELGGALALQEFKVTAPRSGASLAVLPADAASVWGLKPFFSTVDELSAWHETPRTQRVFEAVTTGAAKVAGSRIVILSTAGDPAHFSRKVLDHAHADDLWRVHETPGLVPWMDRQRIEGERRRLPESSFRRLFLNEWATSEDRLADEGDLEACVDDEAAHVVPRRGVRYVVAVDVGVKHDATAVVIAHAEPVRGAEYPRVIVDRVQTWNPSRLRPVKLSSVEEWIEEYARRYNRAPVRFDPSQAIHMMQRLRRAGLTIHEFTFTTSSVARLAVNLLTLIRERALALPDSPALLDELRSVRLKETSAGTYRLHHDAGKHDDQAIALALAASFLLERGQARPAKTWSSFKVRPSTRERPRRGTLDRTSLAARLERAWGDAYRPGESRGPL